MGKAGREPQAGKQINCSLNHREDRNPTANRWRRSRGNRAGVAERERKGGLSRLNALGSSSLPPPASLWFKFFRRLGPRPPTARRPVPAPGITAAPQSAPPPAHTSAQPPGGTAAICPRYASTLSRRPLRTLNNIRLEIQDLRRNHTAPPAEQHQPVDRPRDQLPSSITASRRSVATPRSKRPSPQLLQNTRRKGGLLQPRISPLRQHIGNRMRSSHLGPKRRPEVGRTPFDEPPAPPSAPGRSRGSGHRSGPPHRARSPSQTRRGTAFRDPSASLVPSRSTPPSRTRSERSSLARDGVTRCSPRRRSPPERTGPPRRPQETSTGGPGLPRPSGHGPRPNRDPPLRRSAAPAAAACTGQGRPDQTGEGPGRRFLVRVRADDACAPHGPPASA